jgi:RhtB (resistance to homoserine/threonine) family protein
MWVDIYSIAIIGILGAMSPGPDFAVVSKNALCHSRQTGYFTALGISAGLILHSTYCILGLALLISESIWLFSGIRYLGASYLIYIGIKNLMAHQDKGEGSLSFQTPKSNWGAFKEGFWVNVLNPKCILFMLSIFTMVVTPQTPYWLQGIFVLELLATGLLWFCTLSYLLTHSRVEKRLAPIQLWITRFLGAFLIGFGLHLLLP